MERAYTELKGGPKRGTKSNNRGKEQDYGVKNGENGRSYHLTTHITTWTEKKRCAHRFMQEYGGSAKPSSWSIGKGKKGSKLRYWECTAKNDNKLSKKGAIAHLVLRGPEQKC